MATALAIGLAAAQPMAAGPAIGPAIRINAEVVTSYELDQRIRLMQILNQPGDVPALARQSLIDDRLRHAAAKALGVSVAEDDISQGMTEFAARGSLSLDQLLGLLAQNGVDAAALRDFVKAGLEWRAAVRAKFAGKITVTEAEIDRAIAAGVAAGGELQVLLSEIRLDSASDKGDPALLAQRITEGAHTLNAFQVYAQKYSVAPSARAGGQLDWLALSTLPPNVADAIKALKPGQMTTALTVDGGLAIYWLRDESEGPGQGPTPTEVDILRLTHPAADEALLHAAASRATRCGDLYPAGRGLPEDALQRQTLPEAGLPADLAQTLRAMDPGETQIRPTGAGTVELLMLCDRHPQSQVPPSRDAVRFQLLNRKLALLAEGWLEQMRSDAIVTDQ